MAGYYLYRMTFLDGTKRRHVINGICGLLELSSAEFTDSALDIDTPGRPREHLLAHEETISSGNSQDECNLVVARPGSGPIWSLATQDELPLDELNIKTPLCQIADRDQVRHELFQITDSVSLASVARSVESAQLIIADGHHRIERAMKKLVRSDGNTVVKLLCFVTNLGTLDAEIRSIHRCFKTDLSTREIVDRLEARYHLNVINFDSDFAPALPDSLIALTDENAYSLVPIVAGKNTNDATQAQEIAHLLEARSTQYITDIQKLRGKVNGNSRKIGLITRPLSIDQIRQAALTQQPLPAKSTLFYPKPLPGMLLGNMLNL